MSRMIRVIAGVLITIGLLGATVGALALVFNNHEDDRDTWLAVVFSGLSMMIGGIWVMAAGGVTTSRRIDRIVAISSALGTFTAMGLVQYMLLRHDVDGAVPGWMPPLAGIAAMFGIGLLIVLMLVSLRPTGELARVVRITATCVTLGTMAMILFAIVMNSRLDEWAEGLTAMASIGGTALSAILSVIAHRLVRAEQRSRGRLGETVAESIMLELDCPRCGQTRRAPAGVSACLKCSHALSVAVEEPRCECGYQLFRLEAATCPECGRPVRRSPVPA